MQSAIEILMSRKAGKISAQSHTTLSIQFLERENNDKTVHRRWKNRFVYSSMGLCGNFIEKPNKCRKLISASNAPTLSFGKLDASRVVSMETNFLHTGRIGMSLCNTHGNLGLKTKLKT